MSDKITILVVDDIVINRIMIKEMVNTEDVVCIEATNGKEALDILGTASVDIVFMDIEMPVMNGIETIRNIRNLSNPEKAKTIVIGLTAHDPDYFFEDYTNAPFDEVITKPYTPDKLTSVIHKYLK